MLRHLELRPAVHALCGHRDFLKFLLTTSQWKILEQMEETLKVSIPPSQYRYLQSMLIDFLNSFILKRRT